MNKPDTSREAILRYVDRIWLTDPEPERTERILRALLSERDALQAKAAEDALQYLADTGQLFDKIEEAYAAGFESCRKMAVDELIKAAPKFGPEGPHTSEEYGENEGFKLSLEVVSAIQPQQKDGSDE